MDNPFKVGDLVVSLEAATDIDEGGVYTVRGVDADLISYRDNGGVLRRRYWDSHRAAVEGQDYTARTLVPPLAAASCEGDLQPSGHHPDGSGVQKHSAGGMYPYVLCYRDSKAAGRKYDVGIIGPRLLDTCWVAGMDEAVSIINALKG